jgi:hemerythrin-like domain-containing protein
MNNRTVFEQSAKEANMATENILQTRRGFITASAVGVGLLLSGSAGLFLAAGCQESKEEEIGPVEDLMREHGVLRRVLLIYEEAQHRLDTGQDLPSGVVADSAGIIRRFVEDYHEKLEEKELFPRFEKAGKLVDLVKVLFAQHQAGRRLTDSIIQSSTPAALASAESQRQLAEVLRQFMRMYRPHAAREDTVLFPAFHTLVSAKEFDMLGDKFEDKEKELFGQDGFEKIVKEVADLEMTLGVYELAQFTPNLVGSTSK